MFWVSLMPLNVDFVSEGFSMWGGGGGCFPRKGVGDAH